MKNQSAEDYLDKLLNSVNGEEISEIEEIVETKPLASDMVSKRVSKSEADFLMEFEAELEGDNYDDFLKNFEEEHATSPESRLELDDISLPTSSEAPMMEATEEVELEVSDLQEEDSLFEVPFSEVPENETLENPVLEETISESEHDSEESFSLGGVDLGSLLEDATEESAVEPSFEEDSSGENSTGDGILDDFPLDNLFGDSSEGTDSSGDDIDLGNMGEADLLSLLSGEEFGDIGDLLSQDESGQMPADSPDAFASFADEEMKAQASSENASGTTKGSKAKKGGLLDKLSSILFGLDEEEETEAVYLKGKKGPSAESLSDENDAILASMDKEEKNKKKTKKAKAEKKTKVPKPKKEKKPKKKKEKKPVEIDNTPPLKKGPVFLICLMVISLFVLVLVGTNLVGYASSMATAKTYFNNCEYAQAYEEILGLKIKENDMELYNQVATLATVDSELKAYEVFYTNGRQEEAIDSLICAAGRCEINADNADVYGCALQLETMQKEVTAELKEKYGMTYAEAIELYNLKDRDEYTLALKEKMKELGIE